MILYVLRHGTAEDRSESVDDADRKLTQKGKDRIRDAAAGIRDFGLKFEVILTSPIVRAAETADIVAAAFNNNPSPQVLPALATGVPPADVVATLKPYSRNTDVMIVGHEPQLSAVVSLLLTGSGDLAHLRLKQGGCVALDLGNKFDRGGAQLRWMLTQRQLRKMRK
ncbi:MAG TPA: phosphohistidine phosphatase SixA [Candidatus Binataceae bacterium]